MDFIKWMGSQKTEVQQAFAEHVANLRSALSEERRLRKHADGVIKVLTEARPTPIEETDFSADNKREILLKAIQRRSPDLLLWIRDIFDAYIVYQVSDNAKQYRVDYAIDDQGKVTSLSDPVEVIASTTYTPVTESGSEEFESDFVPLIEKSVRKDGTVPVKLIDPGWGSSGFYSKEVLQRDIPKVFPKGTKMYLDHPTASEESERPERSVKDVAAVLESTPTWKDDGPAGAGIYADMRVREEHREMVNEIGPHIGLSIRAGGLVEQGKADGREGRIIKQISVGESVDLVTDPGRGGKILELFESMRKPKTGTGESPTPLQESAPTLKETDMAEIDDLKKSNADLTEAAGKKDEELSRLREGLLLRDARDHATAALSKIEGLPEATRKRLTESLAKKATADKEGKLDTAAFDKAIEEAVKAEAKYLSEVSGGASFIAGLNSSETTPQDPKALEETTKKLDEAFEGMGLNEAKRKHAVIGRK